MWLRSVALGCFILVCFASSEETFQANTRKLTGDEGSNKQGEQLAKKDEGHEGEKDVSKDTEDKTAYYGKGDAEELSGNTNEPHRKDATNDDLIYLSAASTSTDSDTTVKTEDQDVNQNSENSQSEKINSGEVDNNDREDEKDEDGEDGDEEEEDQDDENGAPLDKNNKKQIVLGRGIGSLGDLMFQYATVSSIARSSKRRAIFSSPFTSMITIFPKAPVVIIEDEEIVQLQPLTNITLSDTLISFDSVKQDIPDEGSVEIVGQTRSWKYFHVILSSLRHELSPAKFYIEAADDYLEEVMRRAVKKDSNGNEQSPTKEDNGKVTKNGVKSDDRGFLKYHTKPTDNSKPTEEPKSIIEQMKSPGDEITLVGVHVPAMFTGHKPESGDGQKEESNTDQKKNKDEQAVLNYLRSAMDYYRDEHSISGDYVQFVIVCEHLRWCIDNLNGPGVHFAIGGSAELDLSILARCDHSILTASSVSWWSSWLTGGQVVYPATLSEMNGVPIEDYVFPDWTEI